MKFYIERAVPVKSMVIRFTVLMYDGDNLSGEYEIAEDIDPHVDYEVDENGTRININAAAIQQLLTTRIAEMQLTGLIAKGFEELEWDASEEEDSPQVEINNDESNSTTDGSTELPSVLPVEN